MPRKVDATDIEAQQHIEDLRLRAESYDLDAVNDLATIAASLLVACRQAFVAAERSGADAVDIITQGLSKLKLLPPESDLHDAW